MDAFEWWVVAEYDTIEEAKLAEIAWIAFLREQTVELYNTTDGGDHHNGFLGKKHSMTTRQQMTRERTGRKLKTVYRGEDAGRSKLTRQQVDEIRASSLSHKKLSELYGVVPSQICHIKKGKHWK